MADMNKFNESNVGQLQFSSDLELEGCEFTGISFGDYNLKSVSFVECKFISCNFANQNLTNVTFRECSFETCNLVGVNWCVCKRLDALRFVESKLNLSSFQDLKLKYLEVTRCQVREADFSGADLTHSNFQESMLSGTNFSNANLENADFRNAREYLFDIRKNKIRGAKFSVPDVLHLITALGVEVEF